MKKNKKIRKELGNVALAGFVLGLFFAVFALKEIADSRKKEKK